MNEQKIIRNKSKFLAFSFPLLVMFLSISTAGWLGTATASSQPNKKPTSQPHQHKAHGHKHKAHKHKAHGHKHKAHKHGSHHPKMKHHGMQHDFSDVKRWVKIFENPKRKTYQMPASVAKHMNIRSGMTVADIGAGTGYFLPYLRAVLGHSGELYALDIAAPLVAYMQTRIKKAGWKNVYARQVRPGDPQLGPRSTDRILIANTWHHIRNRLAYAKKLKASLKTGGSLYILDFTMSSPYGPNKRHRLSAKQVKKELQKAGFRVAIVKEKLPHHYIVVGH